MDASVRLVCFPHAGGAASAYFKLAQQLPPQIHVLSVQYPGREDRWAEPRAARLSSLAEAVAEELDRHPGPYALFGHSMGALVAYETARRIEAGGGGARLGELFVSAHLPPSDLHGARTAVPLGEPELRRRLSLLGGTGHAVLSDPDLAELYLPILKADYAALNAYTWVPGDRLRTPLTVLAGAADPLVRPAQTYGWRDLTDGPFDQHVFPGGHFYLHEALPAVARLLSTRLTALSSGTGRQTGAPS
jgi:surfactin synthase thioesterase subunit